MLDAAALPRRQGRGDRRRPARPRGGGGPAARGMEVVVLHVMGHLMERQLDPSAGYLLQKDLERRGIKVHCKAADQGDPRPQPRRGGAARGRHRLRRRHRRDGGRHPPRDPHRHATPGSRSTAASSSTTRCAPPTRRSSSIGECVEHDGTLYGLVAPLYDQAKVVARTLLGEEAAFEPVELSTKLKVTGLRPLLRRRLRRRRRTARRSSSATRRAASTSASSSRTT